MTTSTTTAVSGAISAAIALAKADAAFELAVPAAASAVAKALGEKPSFAHWEATQKDFCAAYMSQRGCVAATAENRFSAVAKVMRESFALEKPAKPTTAAKQKKEQRTKALGEKVALKAQCINLEDTLNKASEAIKAGDTKKATLLATIADDFKKQAETAASKASKDALGLQRDKIRKAITECSDLKALQAAYEIIVGNVPVAEKAASKASKASKAKPATKKATFVDALM